jgi:hypothetical protein
MAICSGCGSAAGVGAAAAAAATGSGAGWGSGSGCGGTRGRSISGTTNAPTGPILRRSHHSPANVAPPRKKATTIHGHHDRAGSSGVATAALGKVGSGAAVVGVALAIGDGVVAGTAVD